MRVCPECFSVPGLKKRILEIRPNYPDEKCDQHPRLKGVPVEPVVKIVDDVFRENYALGVADDRYGRYSGDDLDTVIWDLTGADEDRVVQAIKDGLIEGDSYWPPDGEEPYYSDEYSYLRDRFSLGEHGRLWEAFRRTLLHEGRFFNAGAQALIGKIFDGVQHQRTVHKHGPVYLIKPDGPQSRFFRARIANDESVRDAIEAAVAANLGPPPERLRRPGRLNPSGIAAFYAAFDLPTCVAELRPTVGSIVMAAEFQITEPLCVLDTTRFAEAPKPPDPFAVNAIHRSAQWRFMQTFMQQIAQPISPDDEHLDYIPTQAVAEFLVRHHTFKFGGRPRNIEAIIYRSAQNPGGKNIAILGDAAVVGTGETDKLAPRSQGPDLSVFDLTFDFDFDAGPVRPTRIIPVPETVAAHVVDGAVFPTRPFDLYDPGEDY